MLVSFPVTSWSLCPPFVPLAHFPMHFWPFQTFLGHIGCPNSPKWPQNGLENMRFSSPVCLRAEPAERIFGPLSTFLGPNPKRLPFLGHTGYQNVPDRLQNGLNTQLQAPQVVRIHFWKKHVRPILDPFKTPSWWVRAGQSTPKHS